jgi:hypothetical protein
MKSLVSAVLLVLLMPCSLLFAQEPTTASENLDQTAANSIVDAAVEKMVQENLVGEVKQPTPIDGSALTSPHSISTQTPQITDSLNMIAPSAVPMPLNSCVVDPNVQPTGFVVPTPIFSGPIVVSRPFAVQPVVQHHTCFYTNHVIHAVPNCCFPQMFTNRGRLWRRYR